MKRSRNALPPLLVRWTLPFAAFFCLVVFVLPASVSAGTVSGVVRDGTRGRVVAGADVILLKLQGGMESVAATKTNAQGHFEFDRPEIGALPMLLRVPYRGVLYHEPVPPGTSSADVEVFEPTTDPRAIQVTTHAIALQPKGSDLRVEEEFTVQNDTHPPVAFYKPDGTFDFFLPDGAQLNQVSAWGAAGMPIVQGTLDKGKGRESIAFAFRPGENGVRISYQLPYASNQATVRAASPYTVEKVILAVPPGVQVTTPGFAPAGNEQGWDVYTGEGTAAGASLAISISGVAAPAASAESQNSSVNSRAETAGESATVLPGRLDSLKWVLVVGFAALFTLGVIFLWRRPSGELVAASASSASVSGAAAEAKGRVVGKPDLEIQGSLDELKENLFRLELRRQAGTISEEEYARQRSRAEKVLRDLVKG